MEPTLQKKLKAVAEFCGYPSIPKREYEDFYITTKGVLHINDIRFHTDYNWLMEAWERWKNVGSPIKGAGKFTLPITENILWGSCEDAFDRLYEAIVWYNSLKKI